MPRPKRIPSRFECFRRAAPMRRVRVFFARIVEPVVNCHDATNRPRFVVQARLDYVRLNAKARHAARCRAAQIMKRKSGRNGRIKEGVELRLGLRKADGLKNWGIWSRVPLGNQLEALHGDRDDGKASPSTIDGGSRPPAPHAAPSSRGRARCWPCRATANGISRSQWRCLKSSSLSAYESTSFNGAIPGNMPRLRHARQSRPTRGIPRPVS
jgi:hypothetical protein